MKAKTFAVKSLGDKICIRLISYICGGNIFNFKNLQSFTRVTVILDMNPSLNLN